MDSDNKEVIKIVKIHFILLVKLKNSVIEFLDADCCKWLKVESGLSGLGFISDILTIFLEGMIFFMIHFLKELIDDNFFCFKY